MQASSAAPGGGESLGMSWCEASWSKDKEMQALGSGWKVEPESKVFPWDFSCLASPIKETGQIGKKSQAGAGKGPMGLSPSLRGQWASQ